MAIATTLKHYLRSNRINYEVVPHNHTFTSTSTAQAAKIPVEKLAKSVVFEDEDGYLMAVIPATHHIEIGQLSRQLGRQLGLATEQELAKLFTDCELGAIPPIGKEYGIDVILDDSLSDYPDVYFEAGDHRDVIHVKGSDFARMMQGAKHGMFCHRA
jgi:Ala-tRNA(Pro) deacylase